MLKRLSIFGNVGYDPIQRSSKTGNKFVVFSVGVPSGTKENPHTDWVDVLCNKQQADFALKHVKKGMRVFVEGRNKINIYYKNDEAIAIEQLYAYKILPGVSASHAEHNYSEPLSEYAEEALTEDDIPTYEPENA